MAPPPFTGLRSDYLITADVAGNITVQDLRQGSPDGTVTLSNVSKITFTDLELNVVLGTPASEFSLAGTSGDDLVIGMGGEDTYLGSRGRDTYIANDPSNPLNYTDVDYRAEGGPNGIVIRLHQGTGTDTWGDTDTFFGVQGIFGTDRNDDVTGDMANNLFRPMAGDDRFDGGGGNDEISYRNDTRLSHVVVDLSAGTGRKVYATAPIDTRTEYTDTLVDVENVRGTAGADTITGNAANNRLRGLQGADILDGKGGFDTADYSHDARQQIPGTAGIVADLAAGTIKDGWGDIDQVSNIEAVTGTNVADIISGDGNGNFFMGHGGDDVIDGRSGFDTAGFSGNRADYTVTRLADGRLTVQDTRNGSPDGTDTLTSIEQLNFADGQVLANVIAPDPDAATFAGPRWAYLITADAAGTITLQDTRPGSPDGTRTVSGVQRLDFADGQLNVVLGTPASEFSLAGTSGDDLVIGMGGEDTYLGSRGRDTYIANDPSNPLNYTDVDYRAEGGPNGVVIRLHQGTGTDTYGDTDTFFGIQGILGTDHNDDVTGDMANNLFRPMAGDDRFDGGGGNDEISYRNDTRLSHVVVDLGAGTGRKVYATAPIDTRTEYTDTLMDVENVRGTAGADTITGNAVNNRLRGLQGADILDGKGGFDTADYSHDARQQIPGTAGIVADLAAGTIKDGWGDIDQVSNIEAVTGTNVADIISGDGNGNFFMGHGGDDVIDGRSGFDTVGFSGNRADYTVTRLADGRLTVQDTRNGSPDGTDTLTSIEQLNFADQQVAASIFDPVVVTPPAPPVTPPPPAPPAEVVTKTIDAVLPGLASPAIDALKEKLATGAITYEELVETLVQEAQSSTVPALVMSNLLGGAAPTQEHLAELTVFAQQQFVAYAAAGVLNPALGPYEAIGLGFTETPAFQEKYGALPVQDFLSSAYGEVFGRAATPEQQNHFTAQINYFVALYRSAGIAEEAAILKAKGAIIGQMMGHAVLDEADQHDYDDAANGFLKSAIEGNAGYGDPLGMI